MEYIYLKDTMKFSVSVSEKKVYNWLRVNTTTLQTGKTDYKYLKKIQL